MKIQFPSLFISFFLFHHSQMGHVRECPPIQICRLSFLWFPCLQSTYPSLKLLNDNSRTIFAFFHHMNQIYIYIYRHVRMSYTNSMNQNKRNMDPIFERECSPRKKHRGRVKNVRTIPPLDYGSTPVGAMNTIDLCTILKELKAVYIPDVINRDEFTNFVIRYRTDRLIDMCPHDSIMPNITLHAERLRRRLENGLARYNVSFRVLLHDTTMLNSVLTGVIGFGAILKLLHMYLTSLPLPHTVEACCEYIQADMCDQPMVYTGVDESYPSDLFLDPCDPFSPQSLDFLMNDDDDVSQTDSIEYQMCPPIQSSSYLKPVHMPSVLSKRYMKKGATIQIFTSVPDLVRTNRNRILDKCARIPEQLDRDDFTDFVRHMRNSSASGRVKSIESNEAFIQKRVALIFKGLDIVEGSLQEKLNDQQLLMMITEIEQYGCFSAVFTILTKYLLQIK